MSSRPDVTAMLSAELERQVLSKFRLWGSEVKLCEGDRFGAPQGGRVDYMAFEPLDMSCSVRSIEAGTVHVFEVKSCMDDLKSGHGMNLVGDVNWLVCTADLWREIVEKEVNTSGWKPLVWDWVKPGKFNPTNARYEPWEMTGRKMPVSKAMWLILMASGKAVKR